MARQDREAAILEVATDLFASSGYHGATTKLVAEQAGVSETLVLKYFGSKKDLFKEAVVGRLIATLQAALAPFPTGEVTGGPLQAFMRDWSRIVHEERDLLLAVVGSLRSIPEVAAEIGATLRAALEETVEEISRRQSANQEVYTPYDARAATYATLGFASLVGLLGELADDLQAGFVEILMVGILTPEGRHAWEGEAGRLPRAAAGLTGPRLNVRPE